MKDIEHKLSQETAHVHFAPPWGKLVAGIALAWALFQLWLASPLPFTLGFGLISGTAARGIHLGFALLLCFLSFGFFKASHLGGLSDDPDDFRYLRKPSYVDLLLALTGTFVPLYLWLNYEGISERAGTLLTFELFGSTVPVEMIIGLTGIALLLEATRRAVGLPLVIISIVFLIYSWLGPYMPDLIAHKGVSFSRLAGYQWLTGEAIFGIPIDVSVRFIFLFVVFGSLLDRAGAGQFFIELAMSLVGRYRGGPAKAAVLASGMTGMISGSSIANTVTTGTFTIPLMKKTGLSPEKAGAFEVAASVNGQIMPPIMGAAAFVMAELLGISYYDVIIHAFIPAVISYIALFYITDLEAQRLGLKGDLAYRLVRTRDILAEGFHYLLPIALLVYLLMVARMTTGAAVFWAIIFLMVIITVHEVVLAKQLGKPWFGALRKGGAIIISGLIQGAQNMIQVALALATAGIIVGAVAATGLSNSLSSVVETLAGGNLYLLLGLVALLSIILGMGLPTTANYLVVATLMAPVVVEVGSNTGLTLPLIAVHLYVFYFGLMADVTPPVALSAYAAAGISKGDPFKTGIQAFFYSIRTAILPLIFVFNLDLLLVNVSSFVEAVMIFAVSLIAILAFTSITFRWLSGPLSLVQLLILALVSISLFRPDFIMDRFLPAWQATAPSHLEEGLKADQVRLTIKASDGSHDRALIIAKPKGAVSISFKSLGVSAAPLGAGQYQITDPGFFSPASKAGIDFEDVITLVEVKNTDRPSPRWIYIPALLAFFALFAFQRRKSRESAS